MKHEASDGNTRLLSARLHGISRAACLGGYRLLVVEVNVIRQETACVLNTAGWTLPVHTVPVSLSDFHLSSRCSESNSVSHMLGLASLPVPFFSIILFFSNLKNLYRLLASSSSPLLPLCVFCFWHRSPIIYSTPALTTEPPLRKNPARRRLFRIRERRDLISPLILNRI